MPCTVKKTFRCAAVASCQLIVQVKSNQPSLLTAITQFCRDNPTSQGHRSLDDKARSRHEERRTEVFALGDALADSDWHRLVKAVVRVERNRLDRNAKTGLWKASSETAYYVANFEPTPSDAAHAIRQHWSIENRHHYTRDGTMGEDASRVRKNPGIMAPIRSFTANIMRANKVTNMTDTRYRNALGGIDYLALYTFM